MAKLKFDYAAALKDGATKSEIAKHLSKRTNFDYNTAIREGITDEEIIDHLVEIPAVSRIQEDSWTDTLIKAGGQLAVSTINAFSSLRDLPVDAGVGTIYRHGTDEMKRAVEKSGLAQRFQEGREVRGLYEEKISDLQPDVEYGTPKYYASETAKTVGQYAGYTLPAIVAGVPAVGLSAMATQAGLEGYREQVKAGKSPLQGLAVGLAKGASAYLTEKIPLKIATGKGPILKKMAAMLVAEPLTEEIDAAVGLAIDKMTISPDMTWADVARTLKDTGIITVLAGPLQAGITAKVASARQKQIDKRVNNIKNIELQELDKAVKNVQARGEEVTPRDFIETAQIQAEVSPETAERTVEAAPVAMQIQEDIKAPQELLPAKTSEMLVEEAELEDQVSLEEETEIVKEEEKKKQRAFAKDKENIVRDDWRTMILKDGTEIYQEGKTKFSQWFDEMRKRYGDQVLPFERDVYNAIKGAEATKDRIRKRLQRRDVYLKRQINQTIGGLRVNRLLTMTTEQLLKLKLKAERRAAQRAFLEGARAKAEKLKAAERAKKIISTMVSNIKKASAAKMDIKYKKMIRSIVNGFDLKKRTSRTLARRESMRKFVEAEREAGRDVDIPQEQLEMLEKVSLNNISYDELRQIHDIIMKLSHQGKLKNKMLRSRDKRKLDTIKKDAVDTITEGEGLVNDPTVSTQFGDIKSKYARLKKKFSKTSKYVAMHLRPERILNMLDGWKNGPMTRNVFDPLLQSKAQEMAAIDQKEAMFKDIFGDMISQKYASEKYDIGRLRGVSKDFMLFVYANSFNRANRNHLYGSGINDQDIDNITQALTDREKGAVQDLFEYYDKVQHPELAKVWGEMKGEILGKERNYFPIMNLDKISSLNALEIELARRSAARKPGFNRGFTKARVKSTKGFNKFSFFETLYKNMENVEHYKAFAPSIKDATSVLYDSNIKAAIKQKYGDAIYEQLTQWVKDVAYGNGGKQVNDVMSTVSRFLRQNYAVSVLGFNLVTMAKQPASFIQGAGMIGPANAVGGLMEFMKRPLSLIKEVDSKSIFMKKRGMQQERELAEMARGRGAIGQLGAKKVYQKLREASMAPILAADKITTTALWYGAYQKSLAEGTSDIDAQSYANEVIRKTQPTGSDLNLAGVFRGPEYQKLYTMFKNQLNQNFNLVYELYKKFGKQDKSWGNVRKFIEGNIMYALLPSMLIGLIGRKSLPDEPEDYAKDMLNQVGGGMLFIGPLMQDYATYSPLSNIEKEVSAYKKSKKPETKLKHAVRGISHITGVPYIGIERAITRKPFGSRRRATRLYTP